MWRDAPLPSPAWDCTGRCSNAARRPDSPHRKQAFVLAQRFEFAGALVVAACCRWAGLRWLIPTRLSTPPAQLSLIANALAIVIATVDPAVGRDLSRARDRATLIAPAIVASAWRRAGAAADDAAALRPAIAG
jgi:hypothetical protein